MPKKSRLEKLLDEYHKLPKKISPEKTQAFLERYRAWCNERCGLQRENDTSFRDIAGTLVFILGGKISAKRLTEARETRIAMELYKHLIENYPEFRETEENPSGLRHFPDIPNELGHEHYVLESAKRLLKG